MLEDFMFLVTGILEFDKQFLYELLWYDKWAEISIFNLEMHATNTKWAQSIEPNSTLKSISLFNISRNLDWIIMMKNLETID